MNKLFAFLLVLWMGIWVFVGLILAPIVTGILIGISSGQNGIKKSIDNL